MYPRARLAPTTMTAAEQEALLAVTRGHPRDHLMISLALGTGLRLRELLGLNVGDFTADGIIVRTRVRLDPATTKGHRPGEMFVPARLAGKLRRYLAWRRRSGQPMGPEAPLFLSQHGGRLSKRRTQQILERWQRRAGFDRVYGFHCLRHSAITNVYRASKDVLLTQRFARHSHLATTTAYTHPSDEDLYMSVQGIRC